MPEGPEIRRAADRVARVLEGREIVEAWFAFPRLEPFIPRLTGAIVEAVDTRGKAMLTRFDNGLTLYSHNQLYGRWYTVPRDRSPDTGRSLRVALYTDEHSALLYSASDVEVLEPDELDSHPFLSRIGPDILDESLTAKRVADRLASDRFRRRALGGLFLDQAFLAGIGNYLRSEILFNARVHPATRPADLARRDLTRIGRETLKIARRSYRTKGVTVPPSLARRLKDRGDRYGAYRFWIYGRDGEACRECGTRVERMDVSSRGLYYCPSCQRRTDA